MQYEILINKIFRVRNFNTLDNTKSTIYKLAAVVLGIGMSPLQFDNKV